MELIADGVLILAAVVAGLYCLVLSRRLRSLSRTDSGLGEAIKEMSARVDEMNTALVDAKRAAESSALEFHTQAEAAQKAVRKLERLLDEAKALEKSRKASPGGEGESLTPDSGPAPLPKALSTQNLQKQESQVDSPERSKASRPIDNLLASYLDAFKDEDEDEIARRLVSALAKSEPLKKGAPT